MVGTGYWGSKLVSEYISLSRKRNDFELTCVADSNDERLKSVAQEHNIPRSMLDLDIANVLKRRSVQAVHLAIPNDTHYPYAMKVLDSGRHLLLEKPMALTAPQAYQLARKAKELSLVLQVDHIFRFNNALREVKSRILQDAIGRILYVKLDWSALYDASEGRDIVFDLAPHPVDIVNFITDEWPVKVWAKGRAFGKSRERVEAASITIELSRQILAHIWLSWRYHGPKSRIVSITGETGTIVADALNQHATLYRNASAERIPVEANNTIESAIAHFIEIVTRGGTSENNALMGAMNVAVLSAARESMKSGAPASISGSEFHQNTD